MTTSPPPHATFSPRALLNRFELRPKQSFGQNFLSDPGICGRIAQAASKDAHTVIEIGAGLGALTLQLLNEAQQVVAIERDRDLIPVLQEVFATELASGQLELLEADAKSLDYRELISRTKGPHVLAGNLPYQITGPLLRLAMDLGPSLLRGVFLVQKEVADRMLAAPGSDAYGALSVFTHSTFSASRVLKVKGGAFYPPPKVDSAVVALTPLNERVHAPGFDELVRLAFQQRRKTLKNAWSGLRAGPDLEAASKACGIDLKRRGEELSVAEFAAMARALSEVPAP